MQHTTYEKTYRTVDSLMSHPCIIDASIDDIAERITDQLTGRHLLQTHVPRHQVTTLIGQTLRCQHQVCDTVEKPSRTITDVLLSSAFLA